MCKYVYWTLYCVALVMETKECLRRKPQARRETRHLKDGEGEAEIREQMGIDRKERLHASEEKVQGGTGRCSLRFLMFSYSGGKQEREEGKPL